MWYKRTIPLLIVFVTGLIGFTIEYVPHWGASVVLEEVTTAIRIIAGFGLFIGGYSLLHMHTSRIRRRTEGWGYSIFAFLGAAAMIGAGLFNEGQGPLAPSVDGGALDWMYSYIQVPCAATIFSILAFFIASAAYRTFRARNAEALLLLLAAIIVMFGRVPISDALAEGLGMTVNVFGKASDALMGYPNLAAKRGIMIGIALGIISQSLRILSGLERSYLGGGD